MQIVNKIMNMMARYNLHNSYHIVLNWSPHYISIELILILIEDTLRYNVDHSYLKICLPIMANINRIPKTPKVIINLRSFIYTAAINAMIVIKTNIIATFVVIMVNAI